ncbi:trypsin-like peptidase domain-containing protein [Planococcus shixiaomingii]|uniref:trypsin-like peptidase domain-containing protein n=1 Tax=Planococcus shixiaomingii TaxID=3058393 RepID=UPI00262FE316|nr:trypsin-like peptidase domain-containing protein [Planococcus sp. N022]WKA53982.1 trypsin-like peptidase domain-containing protein [Planococcus sp. N022]
MFCSNCGQKNEEGAKFCRDCGQPMELGKKNASKQKKLMTGLIVGVIVTGGGFGLQQFLANETEKEVASVSETKQVAAKEKEPEEQPKKSVTADKAAEKKEPAKEQKAKVEVQKKEKKTIIKETQQKVYTIFTGEGQGSGFLFTKGGTVVTNAHVVAGYTDVTVRNKDGQEYPGRVIGISDVEDIALIQVDAFNGTAPLSVELNVTDVGAEVIALGSPNGLENSASIGYLTGTGRDIVFEFQYEDVYQVDVQIAPGSSGGPLIDAESGNVIGINSLLYNEGNAIGFSIPMHSVTNTLKGWASNPMSSGEVAALFGVYDDYESYSYDEESASDADENTTDNVVFEEAALSEFLGNYRYNYELALDNEDFSYVSGYLLSDSLIYSEVAEYIEEIRGKGMLFDFTENTVLSVDIYEKYALVRTYEAFDFMNAAGEWTVEERTKTYTVVKDNYGYYVADITID